MNEKDAETRKRINRIIGGKKAVKSGSRAEKMFDDYIAPCARIALVKNHPTRSKNGAFLEKGQVDRVGVSHSVAVAIEIKASVKNWYATKDTLPAHEWEFLKKFRWCGGFPFLVVCENVNSPERNWRILSINDTMAECPKRNDPRWRDLESLQELSRYI